MDDGDDDGYYPGPPPPPNPNPEPIPEPGPGGGDDGGVPGTGTGSTSWGDTQGSDAANGWQSATNNFNFDSSVNACYAPQLGSYDFGTSDTTGDPFFSPTNSTQNLTFSDVATSIGDSGVLSSTESSVEPPEDITSAPAMLNEASTDIILKAAESSGNPLISAFAQGYDFGNAASDKNPGSLISYGADKIGDFISDAGTRIQESTLQSGAADFADQAFAFTPVATEEVAEVTILDGLGTFAAGLAVEAVGTALSLFFAPLLISQQLAGPEKDELPPTLRPGLK